MLQNKLKLTSLTFIITIITIILIILTLSDILFSSSNDLTSARLARVWRLRLRQLSAKHRVSSCVESSALCR